MPIFTNTATLSYNGNTISSNTVTGNILEVLSMTKTALRDVYSVGDEITYVISILNVGTSPFSGLTLTDDLGSYVQTGIARYPLTYIDGSVLYYQNGVLQADPTVRSTQPLTLTGISVPAGGNSMIIYQARVNEFAPLGVDGSITNTVTASGGSVTTPVIASETITAEEGPQLSITKALSPLTVIENSRLTYIFTISNRGNTDAVATDDIVLSDLFNPILSDITVEYNGVAVDPSNYTYNETTGQFATVAGFITVPAATFVQDPVTGVWTTIPGEVTLTVTGTV